MQGAISAKLEALRAKKVIVDVSGAGSISVFAADELDVTISGAATVDYHGNPKKLHESISGAGVLRKK